MASLEAESPGSGGGEPAAPNVAVPETKLMLRSLDMAQLPGIVVQQASTGGWKSDGHHGGKGGGRR